MMENLTTSKGEKAYIALKNNKDEKEYYENYQLF